MIATLRQRDFSLLWFGGLLSIAGDLLLLVALPFFVYERTGSVLATGTMFIAQTLPRLLFGSVAGVFVDRWDRKRTMVAADLSRASILLLLFVVATGGSLWFIYAVAFLEAAVSQFFIPAKNATIPNLVAERQLTSANSLNAMTEDIPSLIVPPLGGALLALIGLGGLVSLDVATYLVSAGMISLIAVRQSKLEEEPAATEGLATSAWTGVWREWLEGLRVVSADRRVAAVFVIVATALIGEGVIWVLLVVFIKEALGGSALAFGWLLAGYGLGSILGGFAAGWLSSVVRPTRLVALGFAANGALLLTMFNVAVLPVVLVLSVPAGATVLLW